MLNELDFLKLPCPKLSWDKNDYKLVLYFYVGKDYNVCKFKFDYYDFVLLYNSSKGSDKLSDKEFMHRLGANSPVLPLVLKFYQLNPTVCKQAIHQDKKKARKFPLKLKKGAVDKLHGISKPRGKHGVGFDKKPPSDFAIDQNKVNTLIFLLNDCVLQAAASWSLQSFNEYKRLYSDLLRANGGSGFISKAKERSLLKDFSSKVASLQK